MKKILVLSLFIQAVNFVYSQPLCDFRGKDSLYINIVGDTVQVCDFAACGYCGSTFAMSVATSADTIYIVQTDTAKDVATCGCIFNLRTSIVGLSTGTYWVVLYRDWLKNKIHKFIKSIQFTYTPSKIQSLKWNGYQSGCIIDAVAKDKFQLIQDFELFPNYPNPFNPSTTINYTVRKTEFVVIKIYDVLGREVKNLLSATILPGDYSLKFEVEDTRSSGIYYYRLIAGTFSKTRMMVLQK